MYTYFPSKIKVLIKNSLISTPLTLFAADQFKQYSKLYSSVSIANCLFPSYDVDHSQDEQVHLDCFCAIANAIEVSLTDIPLIKVLKFTVNYYCIVCNHVSYQSIKLTNLTNT